MQTFVTVPDSQYAHPHTHTSLDVPVNVQRGRYLYFREEIRHESAFTRSGLLRSFLLFCWCTSAGLVSASAAHASRIYHETLDAKKAERNRILVSVLFVVVRNTQSASNAQRRKQPTIWDERHLSPKQAGSATHMFEGREPTPFTQCLKNQELSYQSDCTLTWQVCEFDQGEILVTMLPTFRT